MPISGTVKKSFSYWALLTGVAASLTACLDKEGPKEEYFAQGYGGLRADYYSYTGSGVTNAFGAGAKRLVTRTDAQVFFSLASGSPIPSKVPATNFSIRWTGYLVPPSTGDYMLCTCSDDGMRVILDGQNILSDEAFNNQNARFWGSSPIRMTGGQRYPIRIDYFNNNSSSTARLYWVRNPGSTDWNDVCFSEGKDPMTGALTHDTACGPTAKLSSAIEAVPTGSLVPAGDELDRELAACVSTPEYLSAADAPNPADPAVGKALRLFERLSGSRAPLFDTRIKQMADLIRVGQDKDAAKIATRDNGFYDKVVRNFAARISTRAETPDVPLNDFIATVVGVTRDRIDARKLLTGNFLYRAKDILFWHDQSMYSRNKMLFTNQHYLDIDNSGTPLACALEKLDRFDQSSLPKGFEQMVALPEPGVNDSKASAMQPNPDPAGVLTSRAFAEAHIIAGTNRRPIQKAFEYFLCAPLDSIRTVESPDLYVGRDVERFPNGPDSNADFHNQCKSCHGTLDALRPAFASLHFENGILKYVPFFINRPRNITAAMENSNDTKLTPASQEAPGSMVTGNLPIHWKMNHNVSYADGYFVKNTNWVNVFADTTLGARFGFGETSGQGVREFGRMIAKARSFPGCMARRVYSEVCKVDPFAKEFPPEMSSWLDAVGDQFALNGFDLKDLFEAIGINCR